MRKINVKGLAKCFATGFMDGAAMGLNAIRIALTGAATYYCLTNKQYRKQAWFWAYLTAIEVWTARNNIKQTVDDKDSAIGIPFYIYTEDDSDDMEVDEI